jgi:hypothetical protein
MVVISGAQGDVPDGIVTRRLGASRVDFTRAKIGAEGS